MRNLIGKSNKKVNVMRGVVILASFLDLDSALYNESLQKLKLNFTSTYT